MFSLAKVGFDWDRLSIAMIVFLTQLWKESLQCMFISLLTFLSNTLIISYVYYRSQGSLRFSVVFDKQQKVNENVFNLESMNSNSRIQVQTAKFAFPRKGNFYVELYVRSEYDIDEKKIGQTVR